MKTIGLIGGMSWESSRVYYQLANQHVKTLLGSSNSCKCIMTSVNFKEVETYTFSGQWDRIGQMMADCAKQLENAGADIILLCTNTIHLVSEAITSSVDIPFLHIAEATGSAVVQQGLSKVGLLGTRFTMERDFYTKVLEAQFGLEVIIPPEQDRQMVHDIIYNELVKGEFSDHSKEQCKQIIHRLEAWGAEGIILGCTELPLLIPEEEVNLPTFDTTKTHIHKAVEWALAAANTA